MVFSATMYLTGTYDNPSTYYLNRQLLWVALGVVLLILIARVEYHLWLKYSLPLMAITLLVLLAVLIFAPERHGAQRWFLNGSIQPSEFAKLATIIYLANWLSSKKEKIKQVSLGLVPFAILIGIIIGLIVLQDDLSTSVLIGLTALAMFFVAGGEIWQLGLSGGIGGVIVYFLITLTNYRSDRLAEFALDPFSVPPTPGNYQIRQILIALGSGGFTGEGLGNGIQKNGAIPFLTIHTDSIFAVLGEEMGLIGALLVIGLFAFLAYRGFKISLNAPDAFGTLLATGVICNLIFQALINVGVVTSTIPFTGIPMPFISYGGSSMVTSMASIGLLLAISRRTLPPETPEQDESDYATHDLRRWNRRTRVPRSRRRSSA